MRILIVNVSEESLDAVSRALFGQGYEITAKSGLTAEEVLQLSPEVLITEATPSDLSCCGLIAQLRSRTETESLLRIVMIVRGGALERARALDLGVNDVISSPFDATEFAARIRAQFREREPEEELQTKLKSAVQKERYADIAMESLSGGVGKRRAWLVPAVFVFAAVAVLGTLLTLISFRHAS